jgi:hypothetical protein
MITMPGDRCTDKQGGAACAGDCNNSGGGPSMVDSDKPLASGGPIHAPPPSRGKSISRVGGPHMGDGNKQDAGPTHWIDQPGGGPTCGGQWWGPPHKALSPAGWGPQVVDWGKGSSEGEELLSAASHGLLEEQGVGACGRPAGALC